MSLIDPTEAHPPFFASGSAPWGCPIPIAAYHWTITRELSCLSQRFRRGIGRRLCASANGASATDDQRPGDRPNNCRRATQAETF